MGAAALLAAVLLSAAQAQLRTPLEPRTDIPARYISPGDLEIHLRPALPPAADPVAYAPTFFGQQRSQTFDALRAGRLPCQSRAPIGGALANPADCGPTVSVPLLRPAAPGTLSALRVGIDASNPWYQYALARAYDTQQARPGHVGPAGPASPAGSSRTLPLNHAEAARWYAAAGAQGYPDAQYQLATMYESGVGVQQSYPQAQRWYQAAAYGGSQAANRDYAAFFSGRDYSVAPGGAVLYSRETALSGHGDRITLPPGSQVMVYERYPDWVRVFAPAAERWGWMRREQLAFRW